MEGTVRHGASGRRARLLEERDDHRVELRVQALDPRDGRVDERRRGGVAPAHELGLRGGVEEGDFVCHVPERTTVGESGTRCGGGRRALSRVEAVVGPCTTR